MLVRTQTMRGKERKKKNERQRKNRRRDYSPIPMTCPYAASVLNIMLETLLSSDDDLME